MSEKWTKRWGYEVLSEPVRPGVYRLKGGGYLLRGKVTNPRTGKATELLKAVHEATLPQALAAREAMLAEGRANVTAPKPEVPLFCNFAAWLFDRKLNKEKIRSPAGRVKWETIIRLHLAEPFGMLAVSEITHDDVDQWFSSYGPQVRDKKLSPRTANTRLALLRVIMRAAAAKYSFTDPTIGIEPFETTLHPTFTPEEPNSLTPDELPRFLAAMKARFPQHFALVYLGFVTGLRPSSLSPLRIAEDVRWEQNEIWVRRSHTVKQEVMPTTKTGSGYPIGLPKAVMDVLRWHVDTQIEEGPAQESGLLFPSQEGTMRFVAAWDKPMKKAAKAAGIQKKISPKAMRRTYQDLARAAGIESVVKRSISGHATEEMEGWYSTVAPDEQRENLAKVVSLLDHKAKLATAKAAGG